MSFRKSQEKWLILCAGMVLISSLMPHVVSADDELNAWASDLTKIESQMAGRVFESEDLSASNRRDGGNFARTVVANRAARARATVLLLDDLKEGTSLELKAKIRDIFNRLLEFREAKDFLDNRAYLLWQAKADHLLQSDLLEIEELPTNLGDEWDLREDLRAAHTVAILIQTEEAKEGFREVQKEHEAFLESVPKLNSYLKESAHLAWFLETHFKDSAHVGAIVSPFEFGNGDYDPATYFIKSKVRDKVGIEIASPFTRVNEFESFDGLTTLRVSPEAGQSRLDAKKIVWTRDIYDEERGALRSRFSYEFSISGRERSAAQHARDENIIRSLYYDLLWDDRGEIRGHRVTIREKENLQVTEFSKEFDPEDAESQEKEWLFRAEGKESF